MVAHARLELDYRLMRPGWYAPPVARTVFGRPDRIRTCMPLGTRV